MADGAQLVQAGISLNQQLTGVAATLDGVASVGIEVPPVVVDAVATLSAYTMALASNGAGVPVPEPYRSQLGLPPMGSDDTLG